LAANDYIWATGRRKTSVARVRLRAGSGKIVINGDAFEDYFKTEILRTVAQKPLEVTSSLGKFDIIANVHGGGTSGQAGALLHGIARALVDFDADNRPSLKANGYLTRDSRMVERKKYGQRGARRAFQFSKR